MFTYTSSFYSLNYETAIQNTTSNSIGCKDWINVVPKCDISELNQLKQSINMALQLV